MWSPRPEDWCSIPSLQSRSFPALLDHASTQWRASGRVQARPGGCHPIKPGETVTGTHGHYEVVRNLGWGQYSTVWMVKSRTKEKYAAMKVMKAEFTDLPELHEAEYLNRILTADAAHPGFHHNLDLLDEFRVEGPNGEHLCLFTELLGETLASYTQRFPRRRPPIIVVKRILRQVILATMYLYDECNIVHADIKSNNILFTLPDGVMPEAADSPGSAMPLESANATVKLIDVGVACWADRVDEHFTALIQSPELCAPEVAVGAGWGTPADVWSLGRLVRPPPPPFGAHLVTCLDQVYELTTGDFLISSKVNEVSVSYLHTVFFGPYSRRMTQEGKYSSFFFKADGSQVPPQDVSIPLADIVKKLYGGADVDELIQFLHMMFRLEPRERADRILLQIVFTPPSPGLYNF
ncbi:kinase-like protein [Mycena metata]|uniref:non-specific serine/threonine protein kinase n=1 Tax=Mycena metata TaxID=1033252 RepID=A0AAD7NIJ0_9AGAR|nr:kinase-like protein [Mycena metata]